jgi:U3 small nucleolar RNA-associated protein 21
METVHFDAPIVNLSTIGPALLILTADSQMHIRIGGPATAKATSFALPTSNPSIDCHYPVCHPHTYMNKIVLGPHILNFSSQKLLHTLVSAQHSCAVTAIAQSNALDVLAFGYADGTIRLINIKADMVLFSLKQATAVTCLSFRSDGVQHLASVDGEYILIWDLTERSLSKRIDHGSSSNVQYIQGEPLLVIHDHRNAIRVHIFDGKDGESRMLRERAGPSEGISAISFLERGYLVATDMAKSTRILNLHNDAYSIVYKECAPGALGREYVAGLYRHRELHIFNRETTRLHKKVDLKTSKNTRAMVVEVSADKDFALVGFSNGLVTKVNMQSGLERARYTVGVEDDHGSVLALCVHDRGAHIYAVFSSGTIVDLLTRDLTSLKSQVIAAVRSPNNMMACLLDNNVVVILDESLRIVRRFSVTLTKKQLTKACFSCDSRLLIVVAVDHVLVYDILHAQPVDAFMVNGAVSSIAFDPDGFYLGMSFVGSNFVELHTNKAKYGAVLIDSSLEAQSTSRKREREDEIELEGVPRAKWALLDRMDEIRERNKPRQPVFKEQIPFLLQFKDQLPEPGKFTTSSDISQIDGSKSELPSAAMTTRKVISPADGDTVLYEYLKSRSPGEIDLHIRLLAAEDLLEYVEWFARMLKSRKGYEFVNGMMLLFLQLHTDVLLQQQNAAVDEALNQLMQQVDGSWSRLDGMLHEVAGVGGWLAGTSGR